nr:retrovirus-related Pol polyprotein from transposon TNT 1-94 [Tanacetum cinerariifolium]
MVITLKWIYKVKLDELGGILKNKARLVAHGYHQEEGIDFEESFCSGCKIRGYKDFSCICRSQEHGRLPNGCEDCVSEGLAFVEEQLVFYKKNEVVFCDQFDVLKRDASFRESEIITLNLQLEKLKKEKESNQIKIDNFKNASKSLDKLIGSQITDNSKTGLGFTSYNAVAPPPIGLFAPPTIDLSSSGLEEFKQPEFESYKRKASKSVCVDTSNLIKKASDALIIEDWVSDCDKDESEEMIVKSKNVQHKPEQVNQPRKVNQNHKNNRTNWNEIRT